MNALEQMYWRDVAASEISDKAWDDEARQLMRDLRNPRIAAATGREVGAHMNGDKIDQLLPLMAHPNVSIAATEFYNKFFDDVFIPAFEATVSARLKEDADSRLVQLIGESV